VAQNGLEKRPVISFFLFFAIFFIIRLAFKWNDLKQDGEATVIGALVYSVGFGILMVLLPKFNKNKG